MLLVIYCIPSTILFKNYRVKREKRCCCGSRKQCKTLFKDHIVTFKIISLYVYKDLRLKTSDLKSNESRDHFHADCNLLLSPRCGFSFEASFQPKINYFRIHRKCYFPVNLSFFHLFMHSIEVVKN